jgi:MYXO-CTERM domain-containing protein
MSTADRAAALVTWWAATYSRRLPDVVADRRRAELASDLWEQRADGRLVGAPAPAVALSILRRTAAGMPADLRWRHHQLAAARGRPLVPGGRPVLRTLARNWWLILAALVGLFEVAFGAAIPLEEGASFDTVGGGAIIATAGLLVLGGIAVRRRRARVAGDVMIAVGAMPMMPWLWIIPLPVAGLTVIVAAVVDAAEARSLGQRHAPTRRPGDRVLLGVAAALVAVLVAPLVIGAPLWGAFAVAPVLLGLVVYQGLRQGRRAA